MGEPKPSEHTFKQWVGKVHKRDDGRYGFTISTGAVDRDRDTIDPNGWDLKNYKRNPIVLFAHQSRQPPIGRAENIAVRDGALKADVVFADEGTYPLADTVRGLVDQDMLRATSVGFIPQKWSFDEERGGFDFLKQELYEFSLVPIPSNPDALLESRGVDLEPLAEWAEQTLAQVKGSGLWVAKDVYDGMQTIVGMHGKAPAKEPDAGGEGQGEAHAPAEPGSTPGPATPEPAKTAVPDLGMSKSLRLVKGASPISTSITREQVTAAVQRAVMDAAQAAVRQASGRLED